MTITLSTIGSRNVTIDIGPSPFEEAPGGVLISYRLHNGPLTIALTVHEAQSADRRDHRAAHHTTTLVTGAPPPRPPRSLTTLAVGRGIAASSDLLAD